VTTPADPLRILVQSRLDELGIGEREAARRSGSTVSYEYIRQITKGAHGRRSSRPGARVVEGLSRALGVPEARLWEAWGLSVPERWVPPEKAHRMTARERRLVEEFIALVVDNRELPDRG
jgi:hypothetical protein